MSLCNLQSTQALSPSASPALASSKPSVVPLFCRLRLRPCSEGNTAIVTIVDRFSKMAHCVPLPKLPTTKETAQLLLQHIFQLHSSILLSSGQNSANWWGLPSVCHYFHPQSNGQTERMNQDFEVTLWCMVSWDPASWSSLLPWVEYAHNSLPNSAMRHSPLQSVFGYKPPLLPSLSFDILCHSALAYICQWRWTWAHFTGLARRYGFPPGTCLFRCNPGSWHRGFWVHSLSRRSSA